MAANLVYDAVTETLGIAGSCEDADCSVLGEALETFGRMTRNLAVDLTHVVHLSAASAQLLAKFGREALRDGRSISVTAEPDSSVEHAVVAAAARSQPPQPLE